MSTASVLEKPVSKPSKEDSLEKLIRESWKVIAPFWPLRNLIAVNPLQGFEHLPFEEALVQSKVYFQQESLPRAMEAINRETIKWLQAYLDEGQATIHMPQKKLGLYLSWKVLAIYDENLHSKNAKKMDWLNSLPDSPKQALAQCLKDLEIPQKERGLFLKLLLTSMHGWASYIKYQNEWAGQDDKNSYRAGQVDYLCMRAVITYLLWPEARELLDWHKKTLEESKGQETSFRHMEQLEKNYRISLINRLKSQKCKKRRTPAAQLVFCIDVRSEPFRKALEATGDYETFGFAGFFGVPAQITNATTKATYASCPVLLTPKCEVKESPSCAKDLLKDQRGYARLTMIKKIYQSIKYSFATPFALAEGLGIFSGIWAGLRTFFPNLAFKLQSATTNLFRKPIDLTQSIDGISFKDQCAYAEGVLRMMGLTEHFASLIVFCGHGSSTQNNAYASALDCGACGGNHGSGSARLLANILNQSEVKKYLSEKGILIPETTQFIGAEHNTTTDEVILYHPKNSDLLRQLEQDLRQARQVNNGLRLKKMEEGSSSSLSQLHLNLNFGLSSSDASKFPQDEGEKANVQAIERRSQDWAQVRPEWGLAKNAAFIVGPRSLTRSLDLDGRCFLHSYDESQDVDGKFLQTILTAPMVVAQWINSQYLFSTLDNTSFGGGSKVTKNITGKIGVIQGNASDLMTGLPLQSVCSSDKAYYHQPQRLLTIVYASPEKLDPIIQAEPVLQKLFGNGWVHLVCLDPKNHSFYLFQRDFRWEQVD